MAHRQIFFRDGLKYLLIVAFSLLTVSCGGGSGGATGSVSLSWLAPDMREDFSGLDTAEIGGFRIYYGAVEGVYTGQIDITDPTATEFTATNLPSGNFFIVMTALDSDGRESEYSAPVIETSF